MNGTGRLVRWVLVGVGALVIAGIGFWIVGYVRVPAYEMIGLGTLGGDHGQACAVNNAGQVVGYSYAGSDGKTLRAFLWEEGAGMKDMGTLGGEQAIAHDINGRGQVVGEADTADGDRHAFLWDPNRGMTDLGTLGGKTSSARAISGSGHVAGQAEIATGQVHAFVWDPNQGMIDLGCQDGTFSTALGINSRMEAVGYWRDPNGRDRAFRWDRVSGMTPLGRTDGHATGINDAGVVVGHLLSAKVNNYQAFTWTPGTEPRMMGLSNRESYADKICSSGLILGHIRTYKFLFMPAGHFYYLRAFSGGRMVNLSKAKSPETQILTTACGVNDKGWVVGNLRDLGTNPPRGMIVPSLLRPVVH